MAKRTILSIPDPRLRKVCSHVDQFDDKLKNLSDDLLETMYAAPGIGLAAPQVGVLIRLLVMDCEKGDNEPEPKILINPEIFWASKEKIPYEEGCLSIPETNALIERPTEVKVRYKDLKGKDREEKFSSLWATCVQHEIDHLDGKLFIDYLGSVKRGLIMNKIRRLHREKTRKAKESKIKGLME